MNDLTIRMVATIEMQKLKNKLSVLHDVDISSKEYNEHKLKYTTDCINAIENAFKLLGKP